MSAPKIYSDWFLIFERFGKGDDSAIEEMIAGSFKLDAGTATRFYSIAEQVYKKRKQKWLAGFQRSFQLQNIRADDDFAISLRNGRQNLLPLSKFVCAKGLPDDLRATLQNDLNEFVNDIKKSIRDSLSKSGSNREKMLLMLNSFGLPEAHQSNAVPDKADGNEKNSASSNGRKIIF